LPNNVINHQDADHVSGPLPYRQLSPRSEFGPATYDTLSQPQKNQLGEGDQHERHRKILRYGRSYFSLLTEPEPRSILRDSCSLQRTTPPLQSPIESEAQPIVKPPGHDLQFPGHGVNKVKSNVKWNDNLEIRFLQGEDIREYSQKLLVHTESSCVLPPTSYLMLSAIGIDTSARELMYSSTWSSPSLSNDIISFL
jgi:hypothetical protein